MYFPQIFLRALSKLSLFLIVFQAFGQVGVGTTNPEAMLDITATASGLLIPRVALTGATDVTTVSIPGSTGVALSTLIYHAGSVALPTAGFYYWEGSQWRMLLNNEQQVYTGKFRITGTGSLNVVGLPFKPNSITFTAHANVENYNINADNGVANNANTVANTYGSMNGYAHQDAGAIDQQTTFVGGSGSSINDISRFASSTECIGVRYANNNGDALGYTRSSLTSFNADGFTLNVNDADDNLVVLYTAYKY